MLISTTNFGIIESSGLLRSAFAWIVDLDLLPEAKELIRSFRRKLVEFLESSEKEEVYKLNIQLFPLSVSAAKIPAL